MTGRRVVLDSNVPLYALGADSPWRDSCDRVMRLIAGGNLRAVASTEMIQEVVHHRLRMVGRPDAAADGRDLAELVDLVAFDEAVLDKALELIEVTNVRGRDAIHAATALTQGISEIVSIDPAFDAVPGLTRLDPRSVASGA